MTRVQSRKHSLASALSNDARLEILKYLAKQGPGRKMCARELAEDLDREPRVVSYHVEVLDESGAIKRVDTEPSTGPLGHFYVFDIDEPWALALVGLGDRGEAGGASEGDGTTPADR